MSGIPFTVKLYIATVILRDLYLTYFNRKRRVVFISILTSPGAFKLPKPYRLSALTLILPEDATISLSFMICVV